MQMPIWFFQFANPAALFIDATVTAPNRARACELLEPIMQELDPARSVALRAHPKEGYLWTGDEIAVCLMGQADTKEGVREVTERSSGKRRAYAGHRGQDSLWREVDEVAR